MLESVRGLFSHVWPALVKSLARDLTNDEETWIKVLMLEPRSYIDWDNFAHQINKYKDPLKLIRRPTESPTRIVKKLLVAAPLVGKLPRTRNFALPIARMILQNIDSISDGPCSYNSHGWTTKQSAAFAAWALAQEDASLENRAEQKLRQIFMEKADAVIVIAMAMAPEPRKERDFSSPLTPIRDPS